MIYKNNKLVLEVQNNLKQIVDGVQQKTQHKFGAIYHGAKLVWITVYNAVRSCFGSGVWLGDKPWLETDSWDSKLNN